MRGMTIFQKPSYREIRPMRDRPMRGPPVIYLLTRQTRAEAADQRGPGPPRIRDLE